MSNETQVQEFKGLRAYVKFLCKQKGIKMKEMEQALNVPKGSILDNLDRSIGTDRIVKIIDYLDGDFNIAMRLVPTSRRK